MSVKIIFWGTGNIARNFIKRHILFMQTVEVVGFTDNDKSKWDTFLEKYKIFCPAIILNQKYDYIVILSSFYKEIKSDLLENHLISPSKILSIDEAYQLYMKYAYRVGNSHQFDFESIIAGLSFSDCMCEKMLEGIDNMYAYLYIKDKYAHFIEKFIIDLNNYTMQLSPKALKSDMPIWICWLQGLDSAPDIVKCCINSIVANVEGRIHIITYENYAKYVKINKNIIEKHKLGIISKTHFSDIIRLALLCEYGGIWIDSTILMIDRGLPEYIYQLPIFMYKIRETLDVGYYDPRLFSNWLIKSEKGHPIFRTVYKVLVEWWNTENTTPYFVFHYVMRLVWNIYTKDRSNDYMYQSKLVLYDNNCQILLGIINQKYDEVLWNILKEEQPLQKLSYKRELKKDNSFYEYIVKNYGNSFVKI